VVLATNEEEEEVHHMFHCMALFSCVTRWLVVEARHWQLCATAGRGTRAVCMWSV